MQAYYHIMILDFSQSHTSASSVAALPFGPPLLRRLSLGGCVRMAHQMRYGSRASRHGKGGECRPRRCQGMRTCWGVVEHDTRCLTNPVQDGGGNPYFLQIVRVRLGHDQCSVGGLGGNVDDGLVVRWRVDHDKSSSPAL